MNIHVRNARLQGVSEGHRILQMMESRKRIKDTDGQIDVFGMLADFDIIVLFKSLDGLLGAFLKEERPGVLISTKRPYSVQRFTAAHELGHAVLDHAPSLDSPGVIRCAAAGKPSGALGTFKEFLQEVEADAFAGELLTPRWLLVHHANNQGWSIDDLTNPDVAYQLALRCGCSYEATLRSLVRNGFFSDAQFEATIKTKPKAIKMRARGQTEWLNPWSDVWWLTEKDLSQAIPVASGDTIRLDLPNPAQAHSYWEPDSLPTDLCPLSEASLFALDQVTPGLERSWFYRAQGSGRTSTRFQQYEGGAKAADLTMTLNIRPAEKGLSQAQRTRPAVT